MKEFGTVDSIEELIDFERGDKIIELKDGEEIDVEETLSALVDTNDKKVINMASLFGPSKPRGSIPRPNLRRKTYFSHKKIFGNQSAIIS